MSAGGASYLRFRQVCLVAPRLEPAASDLSFVLGLEICYRDPAVGKYGLENALWPVGDQFIEIVAPIRDGTTAGRFVEKTKGHGGYMAIFDCDDPRARGAHCAAIGVNKIVDHDYGAYTGVQLHPRDCRAAMIEFNKTKGGDVDPAHYSPAGPDWTKHVRADQTRRIRAIEVETPTPLELAAHWGKILQRRVEAESDGAPALHFAEADIRFVRAPDGAPECIGALVFDCVDPDAVFARARSRGYHALDGAFHLAGVNMRPVASA
ncbi:MAG: VOC family protein [Hyphomicrobiales bacterium]|nr:VOC family protein [Hyphomicrobiales bacterium]